MCLKANFAEWEKRHYVPEVGLFWQTGHDDGMEYNINSRQTKDILRGALALNGVAQRYLRPPRRSLTDAELEELAAVLAPLGLLPHR